MSKLVSVPATILAELNIKDGAPTAMDIVWLIQRGNFKLEVYDPMGSELAIVIRETEYTKSNAGIKEQS